MTFLRRETDPLSERVEGKINKVSTRGGPANWRSLFTPGGVYILTSDVELKENRVAEERKSQQSLRKDRSPAVCLYFRAVLYLRECFLSNSKIRLKQYKTHNPRASGPEMQ